MTLVLYVPFYHDMLNMTLFVTHWMLHYGRLLYYAVAHSGKDVIMPSILCMPPFTLNQPQSPQHVVIDWTPTTGPAHGPWYSSAAEVTGNVPSTVFVKYS